MKYTRETLERGTSEYISACRSLDMFLRKKFNCHSCNIGIARETNSIWFQPPHIEGFVRGGSIVRGGSTWASTKLNDTFGVQFHYYIHYDTFHQEDAFTLRVEAKIPCDKLHWEIIKIED